jgi:large subunit ribosomal protein L4
MEFSVKDIQNQPVRTIELRDEVFGHKVRPDLIAMMVRYQLAKRRKGTSSTKTRSEVRGGGRKPYRQKGTGNARQGTIRAPQFRKGGVVFGPTPRDHSHKLPKKVRRKALLSALSEKATTGEMIILDTLELEAPKTKTAAQILSRLETGKTILIALPEENENVRLSVRNIPGVTLMRTEGVNVYDLLRHETFLVTEQAVRMIEERLG